jgi:hypothetical protein
MTHIELFNRIDEHFLREESLARIRAFISTQRQVEGWFKGELLFLFQSLQEENHIEMWQPEWPTNDNRRIDFYLLLEDGPLYIELKSFYHGNQVNAFITLGTCFYFLPNDIIKLANINDGNKFSLVFVTPNPNPENWGNALNAFQHLFPYINEEYIQNNFPDTLYISKIRVNANNI